jgi:hypothetical protein
MPTPNYSFEKRQRELAAKRKKQEKALKKAAAADAKAAVAVTPVNQGGGELPTGAAPPEPG